MQEIQFIAPAALHDEMLRLRNVKQLVFLESLTVLYCVVYFVL